MALQDVEKFFGAIVLADVLGTKGKWQRRNALELMIEYKELLKDVKDVIKQMESLSQSTNAFIFPEIFTISDTIIAIFRGSEKYALYYASLWSTYLISIGINNKIPFRGGLGYGEIFLDRSINLFMGSTIDEVAEWHDKGQIIGIYATPSALFHNYVDYKGPFGENTFVKYTIKLKNSFNYDTWITNWPEFMKRIYDKIQSEDDDKQINIGIKEYIQRKFSDIMKIDDFEKIQNSISFYQDIIGRTN
jgi:hypothetical protein